MNSRLGRLIGPLTLSVLVVAGCAGGTPGSSGTSSTTAVTVQVAKADTTTIDQAFTFTGDVKPASSVEVLPKQSGRIVTESVAESHPALLEMVDRNSTRGPRT